MDTGRFDAWTRRRFGLGVSGLAAGLLGVAAGGEAMRTAVGAARGPLATVGWLGDDQLLRLMREARTMLGADAAAAAWDAGSALSLDEAIAELTTLAGKANQATVSSLGNASGLEKLTARERETLRLVVDGRSDKEIAAALGISPRTVSKHVASIRDKLNAPSRTAAATLAVRYDRI